MSRLEGFSGAMFGRLIAVSNDLNSGSKLWECLTYSPQNILFARRLFGRFEPINSSNHSVSEILNLFLNISDQVKSCISNLLCYKLSIEGVFLKLRVTKRIENAYKCEYSELSCKFQIGANY